MNESCKLFPSCELKIVNGHIEAECESKDAGHELAELLEKEVIIRVKAKVTEASDQGKAK